MLWLIPPVALASAWPDVDTPARTGASSPNDAAVVIGLERYLLLPEVPHARRDAQAFRDFLVYSRGVPPHRVQLLTEGGLESLNQALDRAIGEVGSGGTLWVYFAGHGAADPTNGARLLLGDDVRPDASVFAARGLSVDALTARLAEGGVQGMMILDTCYAGTSRAGESLVPGSRFVVPSYAAAPKGDVTVWTGTSRDQLAMPLEPVRHGAFTYFAIGALRGWADGQIDGTPDGVVTLSEAHEYVGQALRAAQITNQEPSLQGSATLRLASGTLERGPDLASLDTVAAVPAPSAAPSAASGTIQLANLPIVPHDLENARRLALATLRSLGWRVVRQDDTTVVGQVPLSAFSYGERVTVTLRQAQGGTEVSAEVRNLSPVAAVAAQRNRKLEDRFFSELRKQQARAR